MFGQSQAIEALEPFRQAARLPQNKRPDPLVPVGGLCTGLPMANPARPVVDAYAAFRTDEHNIRVCCIVAEPGEQPCFLLRIDNQTVGVYSLARLPAALPVFRRMIELALQPGVTVSDLRAIVRESNA
jgi:hypothetical protein